MSGPPLADGAVTVVDGRIAAVGVDAGPARGKVEDLGNVAILPGLVNAHTHLDLSDVPAPLGRRGIGFADWIAQVVAFRVARKAAGRQPVAMGLDECIRHGTTALGEIAEPDWSAAALSRAAVDCTVFQELIGPTGPRVAPALELARQHVAAAHGEAWRPGLAPHAPYSVHPDLLRGVVTLSAAENVPVAFHLAESREEIELLRTGGGPLRRLLDAWRPGNPARSGPECGRWSSSACSPNPANARDPRQLLGRRGTRLSGRPRRADGGRVLPTDTRLVRASPLPAGENAFLGVAVALGTDSRASSPDLNLLAELRAVAAMHPAIGPEVVLQLGTSRAASALGCGQEAGSPTRASSPTWLSSRCRSAMRPIHTNSCSIRIGRWWQVTIVAGQPHKTRDPGGNMTLPVP